VARWAPSIDNWASGMAHTTANGANREITNAPEWTSSATEPTSWYRHPSIYSHAEPRTRLGLVIHRCAPFCNLGIQARAESYNMGLHLEHLTKLVHSKEGLRAAYAAGIDHQRNGWLRYPPCRWNHPAILAFDESGTCVGGINWGEDHDD
jgi:hypothetical protein